jgi:hypothetical protein
VRVEDRSRAPNELAIRFLYQGGQTDIVAVDVAQVRTNSNLSPRNLSICAESLSDLTHDFVVLQVGSSSNWKFLTRDHGPAWSTTMAPAGPLQMRIVVTGGYDGKWLWAEREVLPRQWRAGVVYDTGVQITDIAQEGCFPCDTQEWK